MTDPAPLVSVIVLNYNGARIIARCLDHLLAQTHAAFEVVVVDNASEDDSVAVIAGYAATGKVRLVRAATNVGVPEGRNLGAAAARGAVLAFIDNDGYARPTWLAEVVRVLDESGAGVVASTVFFNRHKLILNGAGATLAPSGYAHDVGFNEPFEFVEIPHEVLYPMGCGMVVRRSLWEEIAPLDAELFNYYDDVEVGIRAWSRGARVVVAPRAWIDHDLSYSERFTGAKAYLCMQNRIRTVLKYYPASAVLPWLASELVRIARALAARLLARQGPRGAPGPEPRIVARAWMWNARHLRSTLAIRRRFSRRGEYWRRIAAVSDPRMRGADNQALTPDPDRATAELCCDGIADGPMLNFGWYEPQHEGTRCFRWSDRYASIFLRAERPVQQCRLELRTAGPCQSVELRWRTVPELRCVGSTTLHDVTPEWTTRELPAPLRAGLYELLIATSPPARVASRRLGVALASARLD